MRELDGVLGLTEMAGVTIEDGRTGKNIRHELAGLLQQSVYARLAGYEDVNDQELLLRDPAMRAVVGKKALERGAASSQTVSRFETETLATDENIQALSSINHAWVGKAMRLTKAKKVTLDMDSSESPVHGSQEGSAWNGHFNCTCYHPLFVFNQYGDCEGAHLRPGNIHSADGWRKLLEPIVDRYAAIKKKLYFRGDATFASPDIYEYLEDNKVLYTIRLKANSRLYDHVEHLMTRPVGRPSARPKVFYHDFSYRAGSRDRARRVVSKIEWHAGELFPRIGFIVTNLSAKAKNVVRFYNKRGRCESWIKEGKYALAWTRLSCSRFISNQVRLALFVLAYNLGNFLRRFALPSKISHWSLSSVQLSVELTCILGYDPIAVLGCSGDGFPPVTHLAFVRPGSMEEITWEQDGLFAAGEDVDLLLFLQVGDGEAPEQLLGANIRVLQLDQLRTGAVPPAWQSVQLSLESIQDGYAVYRAGLPQSLLPPQHEPDGIKEASAADFTGIDDSVSFLEHASGLGHVHRGLAVPTPNEDYYTSRCSEINGALPNFFRSGGGIQILQAKTMGTDTVNLPCADPAEWLYIAGHHNGTEYRIYGGGYDIDIRSLNNKLGDTELLTVAACNSLTRDSGKVNTVELFRQSGADMVLGYTAGSPLDAGASEINDKLFGYVRQGLPYYEAWLKAHIDTSGLEQAGSAMDVAAGKYYHVEIIDEIYVIASEPL